MNSGIALGILCAAASGFVTRSVEAQAWLPDRAYTEGPGIRVGDVEIHPGIAVRGGYDSNVFRADGAARDVTTVQDGRAVTSRVVNAVEGAPVLAVTPHVHISTLSQQRRLQGEDREGAQGQQPAVTFRGGLALTYLHIFLDRAPKNLEIDTDLLLSILPQRPFNVDLSVAYARNVRPFAQYAGDKNAYDHNIIQPRVRFNFGSRSQVLTGYVGYAPRVTIFESPLYDYLDNIAHGVEVGSAWKFLPNTALVHDGVVEISRYSADDPFVTRSPVLFSDSLRLRTRLGLNGAITRTLGLRVLAGYSLIKFDDTEGSELLDDHEDVVGEAVLSWRFGAGQLSSLELGYGRDVLGSAIGGWLRTDRGFATLRANIGRVFMLTLSGGAGYLTYGSAWGRRGREAVGLGTGGETDRQDVRVDGAIRGEYRVTNWLSFMADVSMQAVMTDFAYALFVADQPVPDPADYKAFMAFGGVRAHY